MRPIQERLTMLAADLREDSRKAGIAAEQARPDVEQTAAILTARREHIEELEAQLAEIKAQLAEARAGHQEATEAHADALAVLAGHERDGQEAADMAARLDLLARGHRAPDDVPPAEALAATGLMPRPFMWGCQVGDRIALHWIDGKCDAGRVADIDGTVLRLESGEEAHAHLIERVEVLPPTEVPADVAGDGTRMNDDHPPAVRRAEEDAARVPATPPVPTEPAAGLTMPDLGAPIEPLPPAEPTGQPRHAAPRDSTSTGRMRAISKALGLVHQPADEQQGDDQ
ncbi:hypothetical protein ACIBI3_02200 [Actinomadura luteofluorescens]|uniref:hypothetical protein n=1 Tax=Actinomadura luteofluorescens TaxID=46163 RepID=UPI003483FE7C